MSFKLALLFVVCFLALSGAIPVEKTEDEDTKQPQPVAAEPEKEAQEEEPEKEATEEDPAPEDNEDEDESEDQSQEDTNDEDNEDEEEPEADDKEEEPENEVEAKEDESDNVKRGSRYHPRCKYVRKRVHRCRYKLRCTGSYYRGRGRCCRKYRHCSYYWRKVRICQICRRRCRRVCSYRYRPACQLHLVCIWKHRGRGRYYRKYRYCRHVRRCRRIRYRFCQIRCYGYRCYWPKRG